MAIIQVKMPSLGESVHHASVVNWLVKPGDKVDRYDPLVEVVSDKVTTQVPSDYVGTVVEYLVELDQEVEIGTAILSLEVESEQVEDACKEIEDVSTKSLETMEEQAAILPNSSKEDPTQLDDAPPKEAFKLNKKERKATRYSPAVVRIASEKGIDLNFVTGTGRGGRITRKDVEHFDPSTIKSTPQNERKQEIPLVDHPISQPVVEAKESKPAVPPIQAMPGKDKVVPADPVRKVIAKKMTQSVNETPHAWMMFKADVTHLVELRNKEKEAFLKREGIPLSYFAFFAKAVTQALVKNPKVNTSWDNGNIIYHGDVNLSIAVTTDDNLFVPVIKQADRYSVSGLAKEINRLASEVRNGTLKSKDMQGGTFTLNNTGSLGSIQSMGIINHPQAAILQVESIQKEFVPTKEGGFKVADRVNLCLSIDHRILDGQQASKFMKDVVQNLNNFTNDATIY